MRLIFAFTLFSFLSGCTTREPHQKPQEPPLATIIRAIIEVESSGNPRAFRFEPHLIKRYGWQKSWGYSYGLTQVVYGFHFKRCGLKSPADLWEPKLNIKCGTKIFLDCRAKTHSLTAALGCYNGDRTGRYARRVEAALARISS